MKVSMTAASWLASRSAAPSCCVRAELSQPGDMILGPSTIKRQAGAAVGPSSGGHLGFELRWRRQTVALGQQRRSNTLQPGRATASSSQDYDGDDGGHRISGRAEGGQQPSRRGRGKGRGGGRGGRGQGGRGGGESSGKARSRSQSADSGRGKGGGRGSQSAEGGRGRGGGRGGQKGQRGGRQGPAGKKKNAGSGSKEPQAASASGAASSSGPASKETLEKKSGGSNEEKKEQKQKQASASDIDERDGPSEEIEEEEKEEQGAPDLTAEEESLELLEWRHLCEQVACFASTSMAAEIAAAGRLPMGTSLEESQELLQETAEAAGALHMLSVSAVLDVRPGLSLLANGGALTGLQLDAVSQSVAAALRVSALLGLCEGDEQLQSAASELTDLPPELQGSLSHCRALKEVMEGAVDGRLIQLLGELKRCVKKGGDLQDGASEFLEFAREEKRANQKELDSIIKSTSQFAFQKGISTSIEGSYQMGRQCLSVKRGRQGDLPSGGTTLASSNTGATLYVEPTEAIPFNNEAAKLAAAVREEEAVVMAALSRGVGSCSDSLLRLLSRVVNLDLACARAKHAAWMGAAQPQLVKAGAASEDAHQISLRQIRHPLLLAKSLPEPPLPPLIGDAVVAFNSRFLGRSDAPPVPLNVQMQQQQQQQEQEQDAGARQAWEPPQGIDLLVPSEASVVAVTGPNTGGKTASLKTLGLASVMAKAGLFLPVAEAEGATATPPRITWFDKVLADVGDGQSLQQSLSTFSGHIRRVQRALEAATPESLVLLDELGSGTDPAEGASLACVLLEDLAEKAALTYVTSHFYEVKELAEEKSPAFVNVAVEFDLSTLSPTYRLLWGEAGSSNALNVATRLGFDPSVVKAAHEVMVELGQGGHGGEERAAELAQSLEEQKAIAQHETEAAARRKAAQLAKAQTLEQELQAMKDRLAAARKEKETLDAEMKDLSGRAKKITSKHLSEALSRQEAEKQIQEIQALVPDTSRAMSALMGLSSVAAAAEPLGWEDLLEDGMETQTTAFDEDWLPAAGERVIVNKMGGGDGVVLRASKRKGGTITVQVGQLSVEMKTSDVSPARKTPGKMSKEQQMNAMISRSSSAKKAKKAPVVSDETDDSVLLFQTSQNTVDVRGRRADAAIEEVETALTRESGSRVLFVVHGVGTGALRKQIHERFNRHSMVRKIEMEEKSAGGCSIFYLK